VKGEMSEMRSYCTCCHSGH